MIGTDFRNRIQIVSTLQSDLKGGYPNIYVAFDNNSESRIILKTWARRSDLDDSDIESIWINEVRKLHRLKGAPGAAEYLTSLLESGKTEEVFYLIFNVGDREPLSTIGKQKLTLENKKNTLLWKNLKRVSKAIGILHSQGILHRRIDEACIYTAKNAIEPDFILGEFEWSLRVSSDSISTLWNTFTGDKYRYYSFQHDWQKFGILAAKLRNIEVQYSVDKGWIPKFIKNKTYLENEKNFISVLIEQKVQENIDISLVESYIDSIISEYEEKLSNTAQTLHLIYDQAVNKGQINYALTDEIRETLELNSVNDFKRFIENDLNEPVLYRLKKTEEHHSKIAIAGNYLTYYLDHNDSSLYFPRVKRIDNKPPNHKFVIEQISGSCNEIAVITPRDLHDNMHNLEASSKSWASLGEYQKESPWQNEKLSKRLGTFSLLNQLDLIYQAAATWAVKIVDCEPAENGKEFYSVEYYEDPVREQLSALLNLDTPLERLSKHLESQQEEKKSSSMIVSSSQYIRVSGSKKGLHTWEFESHGNDEIRKTRFVFSDSVVWDDISIGDIVYLYPPDIKSQLELIRRRAKLIGFLSENSELLKLIENPTTASYQSHESLPESAFLGLDASKREALTEIMSALPFYALQGPPGVGKSYLVCALVKLILQQSSNSRIVITAQGHDTIDNLRSEIESGMDEKSNINVPLIVRTPRRGEAGDESNLKLKQQALSIVRNLKNSMLFKSATDQLQGSVNTLEDQLAEHSADFGIGSPALESLLYRSANVVFSTANSNDLSKMVSTSALFDWSIVEEAGRATGIELLAPLLLSYRRLLIGDPQQLLPFDHQKSTRVINSDNNLEDAIECVSKILDKDSIAFLDADSNNAILSDLNRDEMTSYIQSTILLFESILKRCLKSTRVPRTARMLRFQYRMHPEIASLVSSVFYDDELDTDPVKAEYYRKNSLIGTKDKFILPASPIVFIDMPYCQKREGEFARESRKPFCSNHAEIEVLLNVIANLDPKILENRKPSLSILTPYNHQRSNIIRELSRCDPEIKRILSNFGIGEVRDAVHTIDSFQGDEADVVIASLVRNNSNSGRNALGILGDSRRMNVLLSRAKHKLIVIGSLEFLRKRFLPGQEVDEENPLFFLRKLFIYLDKNQSNENISIIKCDHLRG